MPHILLIEDDPRIRSIVEHGLGARGFVVTSTHDGPSGLEVLRKLEVALVLLDLVLPSMGGLQVLAEIRSLRPRLPVIALTALDDAGSKVNGLDAGADDYVTKPFSMDELAARIRARLRLRDEASTALKAGPLTVDLLTHRAVLDGREVDLSSRELTLLATFVRHAGMVLSRRQLLQTVWEVDFDPKSNVVEVYVAALRRKIGPAFVETVRGRGYRFVTPETTNGTERAAGRFTEPAVGSGMSNATDEPPEEAKR
ncbi:response regulator transcription factor [Streptomyces albidus (ex Kaewkla and Franco 2022)]|uniref:response regulator transcription factor n=1 Tax=Streptomyces albidus (ex Kaewkla and Franco 2022) TaxID=722709 RepID=UPI0015EF1372|nr:response regulator transcription factor [Streptomyces albidus (ex Kaewkla and Franco 2022)]